MSTYIARICRPSRESACLTTTGFGTRAASAHGDEVLDPPAMNASSTPEPSASALELEAKRLAAAFAAVPF
jgi:hypothetical protein